MRGLIIIATLIALAPAAAPCWAAQAPAPPASTTPQPRVHYRPGLRPSPTITVTIPPSWYPPPGAPYQPFPSESCAAFRARMRDSIGGQNADFACPGDR